MGSTLRQPLRLPVLLAALTGAWLTAVLGLQEFGFTDYEVETRPAIDHLLQGDLGGFLGRLPGYAGAVVLDGPFAWLGGTLGGDQALWAWRFQAIPGLLLMVVVATSFGSTLAAAHGGRRGLVWGSVAAALVAGSPFAMQAELIGHPEELLVVGLVLLGVLLAGRDRFVLAGALVGLAAVAKPWALLAVPIVLLAATDRRQAVRALIAAGVAGTLLFLPTWIGAGGARVTPVAHATTAGVFKPANLFWFAGGRNPHWVAGSRSVRFDPAGPAQATTTQRLEPAWAARISHPLILLVGALVAFAFWRLRRAEDRRGPDLLLLLATVLWWRCLLDTWNADYYAFGALAALVGWEALRGRPPFLSLGVTLVAWVTFEQMWSAQRTTPDIHTAVYLAWAVPLGVGLVGRLLAPASAVRAARALSAPVAARLPTLARAARAPGDWA